ncbi:unnamed protein product [Phaedon cochleariae]|uniref:Cuticular protein n=1 Tax=Phaedon cochleariae TaxID=80249 RepID=A0A9P0DLK4_PHACE|nr:unnamed protein product [Phaedon cochleariae]
MTELLQKVVVLTTLFILVHSESVAKILSYKNDLTKDGYDFAFESSDGIKRSEHGEVSPDGKEGALNVMGDYSYISPDGTPVHVYYVAGEGGYRPKVMIGQIARPPPPRPAYFEPTITSSSPRPTFPTITTSSPTIYRTTSTPFRLPTRPPHIPSAARNSLIGGGIDVLDKDFLYMMMPKFAYRPLIMNMHAKFPMKILPAIRRNPHLPPNVYNLL